MQRSSFRLSPPLKAAVYLVFAALLFTGAGWMWAEPRIEEETWERIPRLLLKIHGGAAMLALLLLGALSLHVKRGWRAHRNRLSGVILIAVNAILIATGYGLYYASDEAFRAWLSRWHAWIGLGLTLLIPIHVLVGRIIARRLRAQRHPGLPPASPRPARSLP